MIDYTYTELTSATVTGLVAFQRHFPGYKTKCVGRAGQRWVSVASSPPVARCLAALHLAPRIPHPPTVCREVTRAIARGVQYVRDQQREDGSWYGSWAVCFTYGCWFGVEALVQGGDPTGRDQRALAACSAFLLSKQRADGGWGESYLSCLTKTYCQTDSTAVCTAWALLALIHAQCPDARAVRRGIDFLIARQTPGGDWAQVSPKDGFFVLRSCWVLANASASSARPSVACVRVVLFCLPAGEHLRHLQPHLLHHVHRVPQRLPPVGTGGLPEWLPVSCSLTRSCAPLPALHASRL